MSRSALHDINPRGIYAGMTEEVGQPRYIFLNPIEGNGEQAAKVMQEHFPSVHMSRRAQSLKLLSDVGTVQGLSVSGHKHRTGLDVSLFAIDQQYLPQLLRN